MGLFDKLRNLDKKLQDISEEVRGALNRTAAGTDLPLASDPDALDALEGVLVDRLPYRVRSENPDASGYEYREREVVAGYQTWQEGRNPSRVTDACWIEILHQPAWERDDLLVLRDQYRGSSMWSADPDEWTGTPNYIADEMLHGYVPSTGDPCVLVWLPPAVVRIRRGLLGTDAERRREAFAASRDQLVEVLPQIDRDAIGRWAAAIEPRAGRATRQRTHS